MYPTTGTLTKVNFYASVKLVKKWTIIYQGMQKETTKGKNYWGPKLWLILHTLAENIPCDEKTIHNWRGFLNNTQAVMTCQKCKKHFGEALQKLQLTRTTNIDIRNWLFNLHNEVNLETGKEVLSFENLPSLYKLETQPTWIMLTIQQLHLYWAEREHLLLLHPGIAHMWKTSAIRLVQLIR